MTTPPPVMKSLPYVAESKPESETAPETAPETASETASETPNAEAQTPPTEAPSSSTADSKNKTESQSVAEDRDSDCLGIKRFRGMRANGKGPTSFGDKLRLCTLGFLGVFCCPCFLCCACCFARGLKVDSESIDWSED